MGDSTSAEIFGDAFEYLAKSEHKEAAKDFAKFLWKRQWEYDFTVCEMCELDILRRLLPEEMAKWDKENKDD